MPVELQGGDLVDRVAAPVLADPVVAAGDVEVAVVHELGEHVDRDVGVGVPLGVGVPVGVEHDLRGVEHRAVAGAQRAEAGHPGPVLFFDTGDADVLAAVGVAPRGRQQCQAGARGGGVPGGDAFLLRGDRCGGVLADRQPAAVAVRFDVAVDRDRGAARVAG